MDCGEGARLQHSSNVGGRIECRRVRERCRSGRPEWFAGDQSRQKPRAARREVPDNDHPRDHAISQSTFQRPKILGDLVLAAKCINWFHRNRRDLIARLLSFSSSCG
jgi:hypothetical protein